MARYVGTKVYDDREAVGYCLMNYTVQCKDAASGETGCFLFDIEHYQRTGEFRAVSPVFPDLTQFFAWDSANGNKREGRYIERTR